MCKLQQEAMARNDEMADCRDATVSAKNAIIASQAAELADKQAQIERLAAMAGESEAAIARLLAAGMALHEAVNKHVASDDRTSLGIAFKEMDEAMAAAIGIDERIGLVPAMAGGQVVASGEPLRDALILARTYIEEKGIEMGYGFYRPANPNDFFPDAESCSEEEITAHKAACEAYDRGENRLDKDLGWIGPNVHVLTAPWGIGGYQYRSEEASAALVQINAALDSRPTATKMIRNTKLDGVAGVERDAAEPVAWLKYWAAQSWSGNGNHDVECAEGLAVCKPGEIGDDKMPAFPVYAAPVAQPLAPSGAGGRYVTVPFTATEAMLRAAFSYREIDADDEIANPFLSMVERMYRAMIAAAPASQSLAQNGAVRTWQERRDEDIKLNGEAQANPLAYAAYEIADLRAALAAQPLAASAVPDHFRKHWPDCTQADWEEFQVWHAAKLAREAAPSQQPAASPTEAK